MPRFMIEINRDAFALLESEAKADRRTPQDQAGILLEQMLESKADVDALVDLEPNPTPSSKADASGRDQKPLG